MNEQHELPPSRLPEGATVHTFLVYDPDSGDIVHGHMEVVFPNDEPRSHEELERHALDVAAQATARDSASLKALKVEHHELEHGAHYRVDPGSGRLERQSPR